MSKTGAMFLGEIERRDAVIAELLDALSSTTGALVAAIYLLEHGGKKAAPSNKMFAQMLVDYKKSAEEGRAAIIKATP